VRDGSEECDDGGTIAGDGCGATCTSELVIGNSAKRVQPGDCLVEWLTLPVPAAGKSGVPGTSFECRDDDPSCDFGPPGDGACTFHVALCLNATDSRVLDAKTGEPSCSTVGIDGVLITKPSERSARTTLDGENRAALETALAEVGGTIVGQCKKGLAGSPCTKDADCDTALGVADGACRGRSLRFAPALTGRDVCSGFVDIRVPLRVTSKGAKARTGKVGLTTIPTLEAGVSKRRNAKDAIALTCRP
jgi:cysteine-rich repeat protein